MMARIAARLRSISSPLLSIVFLAACAQSSEVFTGSTFRDNRVFSNLEARHPLEADRPTGRGLVPVDGRVGVTQTFAAERSTGADGPLPADETVAADTAAGAYQFNFNGAPLAEVVRAILSDALGLNYSSSADLSGRVTISSARAVGRDELLGILEAVLAGEGYALEKAAEGYRIAPSGLGASVVDGTTTQPGFGISIVPLRYVSADTMSQILSGFVVASDDLRVAFAQNAVVVRGPSRQRADAVKAILSFDADWMADQSVAIFELRRGRPAAVVAELNRIFASEEEGVAAGAIEFRPIERLRSVLALSSNPKLLQRAQRFVRRLDIANPSVEDNVFVYRARYRDAQELAAVVSRVFGSAPDASLRTEDTVATDDAVDALSDPDGALDGTPSALSLDQRFDDATALIDGTSVGTATSVIDLTTRPTSDEASAIKISADVSNNAVVVYADGETYQKILATLRELDAAPAQVVVNVTIAEVRLTDQLEFGVQYFVKSGSLGLEDDIGSASLFTDVANTLQKQIPGFNFVVGANANPDVIISALDAITDVEVLSSPSLVVVENETASLQVGDTVPVTVRQAQSVQDVDAPVVNQVEFRDTGIILAVTPRIGENDAVTMKITQEISSVASDANSLTPTFSKRRVNSAISVQSGQTVLLAGLISADRTKGRSGVPVLKDIPKVGNLFANTERSERRTELVVLITPSVIRTGEDAQSVAEDLRSRMWTINSRTAQPVYKP